ncbi:hypothetical protein LXL04_023797 [Taraxacum kok-saghyz]
MASSASNNNTNDHLSTLSKLRARRHWVDQQLLKTTTETDELDSSLHQVRQLPMTNATLSRVKSRDGLKILIFDKENKITNKTCNVVFKEVFDNWIGGRYFSEEKSADRQIQRTLMALLNHVDGFDQRRDSLENFAELYMEIKCCTYNSHALDPVRKNFLVRIRQGCSPPMSDSCSDTLRTPAAPSFTQPCSPDENLTGTFLPQLQRWKAAMEKRDREERFALVCCVVAACSTCVVAACKGSSEDEGRGLLWVKEIGDRMKMEFEFEFE